MKAKTPVKPKTVGDVVDQLLRKATRHPSPKIRAWAKRLLAGEKGKG